MSDVKSREKPKNRTYNCWKRFIHGEKHKIKWKITSFPLSQKLKLPQFVSDFSLSTEVFIKNKQFCVKFDKKIVNMAILWVTRLSIKLTY